MFWGVSPALDLLNIYKQHNKIEQGKNELNILLIGSADVRHVLKTIAKFYTHKDLANLTINFYIIELLLEFTAREMLLTLIALEPSIEIGLKEKVNIWMEIYGNLLLRPTTAEYLKRKSLQFKKMITDKGYQVKRMPCLILDNLKYREKDDLETIYKFWYDGKVNMGLYWDNRLRKDLGIRYDSRMGAFDWDYYMKLKEIQGGDVINANEYKQWRSTGVAFTWLEKEFSIGNNTLSVGIELDGDELVSYDEMYLGDNIGGPYFTFGIECEDEEMLKKVNHVGKKRATDITERNLMRFFYEIEYQTKYVHNSGDGDRDLGLIRTPMARLNLEDTQIDIELTNAEDNYSSIPIKHKLIFLPTKTLDDPAKLSKYNRYFDLMFVAQNVIRKLNLCALAMVKNGGQILMETRKYLMLKKEEHEDFEKVVQQLMELAECDKIGGHDYANDNYVSFCVNLKNEINA